MRRGAQQRQEGRDVLFLKAGEERYQDLRKVSDLPDDQWNDYAADFTVTDDVGRVAMCLYNVNSEATASYDEASMQ